MSAAGTLKLQHKIYAPSINIFMEKSNTLVFIVLQKAVYKEWVKVKHNYIIIIIM